MKKKYIWIISLSIAIVILVGSIWYYHNWHIENEKNQKVWQAEFEEVLRDSGPRVIWTAKNLPFLKRNEIGIFDMYYDGYSDIGESIHNIMNQLYAANASLRHLEINCDGLVRICVSQRRPSARKYSNQREKISKHYETLVRLLFDLSEMNILDVEDEKEYQKYKADVNHICSEIDTNLAKFIEETKYLNLDIQ